MQKKLQKWTLEPFNNPTLTKITVNLISTIEPETRKSSLQKYNSYGDEWIKAYWDIKYIDHANEETIRCYIKDARKAENVIFYYTTDKYLSLDNAVVREVGKYTKRNRIHELPDVYYIDPLSGELILHWNK